MEAKYLKSMWAVKIGQFAVHPSQFKSKGFLLRSQGLQSSMQAMQARNLPAVDENWSACLNYTLIPSLEELEEFL